MTDRIEKDGRWTTTGLPYFCVQAVRKIQSYIERGVQMKITIQAGTPQMHGFYISIDPDTGLGDHEWHINAQHARQLAQVLMLLADEVDNLTEAILDEPTSFPGILSAQSGAIQARIDALPPTPLPRDKLIGVVPHWFHGSLGTRCYRLMKNHTLAARIKDNHAEALRQHEARLAMKEVSE